jgi:hypothetical protein
MSTSLITFAQDAEHKDLQKKLTKQSGKVDEYRKNLEEAQGKEQQLKERALKARHKVEEAKFTMQAASSRSQVLSILMKERDSGRLKGIYVGFKDRSLCWLS